MKSRYEARQDRAAAALVHGTNAAACASHVGNERISRLA
jgi:hypothetical protein